MTAADIPYILLLLVSVYLFLNQDDDINTGRRARIPISIWA